MTDKAAQEKIPEALAERLAASRRVVALTGAGVSAESGVPTFRDAQTGLWAKHDPMTLASPDGFARDPQLVWDWYQWRRGLVAGVEPNAGHRALAAMEKRFESFVLITQNVDGLHQHAGSEGVLELHGNIRRNVCSRTGREIDPAWIERHADQRPPPSPHDARGLARPDVVWFGEALEASTLEAAFEAAGSCELMIVAGTAGTVQPAASLPFFARDAGAAVVDINPRGTVIGRMAEWHLKGTSAIWLPRLLETVNARA